MFDLVSVNINKCGKFLKLICIVCKKLEYLFIKQKKKNVWTASGQNSLSQKISPEHPLQNLLLVKKFTVEYSGIVCLLVYLDGKESSTFEDCKGKV